MYRNRSNVSFKIFSAASHILAANNLMEDQRPSTVVQSQFCINVNQQCLIQDILCPVSHICSKNLLETKGPTNQSTKSVCYKFKPSQSLHFKYSVLRLTYAGRTWCTKSVCRINSNRHNNSLEIFCAASHIFSVKPQYRSFLMLQSIISTIRFFSMCIFFQFYTVASKSPQEIFFQ